MGNKSHTVKVGSANLEVDRKIYEEKALQLGLSEFMIEELSDTELQRWVTLKELKDYAEEFTNEHRDDLGL